MHIFEEELSFEWDNGNLEKNWRSHEVSNGECEEVFFSDRKLLLDDVLHSGKEPRYILLGETKESRQLFIVFTIRKGKIRVISARDLSKKERKLYEKAIENSQI